MYRLSFITILFIFLQACGTIGVYSPEEGDYDDGDIPELKLSGNVMVLNIQESKKPIVVYAFSGMQLESNYYDITQLMAVETENQIRKNGRVVKQVKNKTLELKVTYLKSVYGPFHLTANIKFTAKLGNGKKISKSEEYITPLILLNTLQENLDNCISLGVKDLLNDNKVISYLAEGI